MDSVYWRKCIIFCTFLISCGILIVLSTAIATDYWVVASAKRLGPHTADKSSGHVNFGLFNGLKKLNSGFGERITLFKVSELVREQPALLKYGVWLAAIGTLCAAIVFTLLVVVFSVLNTAITPIECLTGVPGLYVWHGLAAVFECCCVLVYGVEFVQRLRHSVFSQTEQQLGWSSQNMAALGYSFWLVCAAMCMHAVCVLLVWYSGRSQRVRKVHIPVDTGATGGVNMIY